MCDCLHRNAVLEYCFRVIESSDKKITTKYGQHYGYFDHNGDITPAGRVIGPVDIHLEAMSAATRFQHAV